MAHGLTASDGRDDTIAARTRPALLARALAGLCLCWTGACVNSNPGAARSKPGASASPEASEAAAQPKAKQAQEPAASASKAPDSTLEVGGATFEIVLEDGRQPAPVDELATWIRSSATMISDYYGGFPVPSLEVTVVTKRRGGVGFGQHWDGRWIRVNVGRGTGPDQFERDWVMVHEMLHAAFPDLDDRHKWMQEGLSTYLEPIVRARAGNMTAEEVWGKWIRMMPYGRPRAVDRGLDNTRTWGSLYWGGALFWLMADLEIRRRTNNEKSLRDALRGIVKAGGDGRVEWSTARVVEVGDRATGTTALRDLYARMAEARGDVDLEATWRQLGVIPGDDKVERFDDDAPLAHIRRAMTTRAP